MSSESKPPIEAPPSAGATPTTDATPSPETAPPARPTSALDATTAANLSRAAYAAGPRNLPEILEVLTNLVEALRQQTPDQLDAIPAALPDPDPPGTPQDALAITPPEALDAPLTSAASWVYVIGAIGYQMVTGQRLFPQDDPARIRQRIELVEPTSPTFVVPDLSEDVEAFLYNCLEKLPDDRYETLDRVAEALDRLQAGRAIHRLRESGFSADEEVFVMEADSDDDPAGKSGEASSSAATSVGNRTPGFLTVIAVTLLVCAWAMLF